MLVSALLAAALSAPSADPAKPFEFKDGDRIVWLGNTLVEREQRYGYWEAALLAANKDKQITVRNLGWSGDTVFGDARAGFDNAAKGFERMVSLTLELKPTVIFVSFGTNEAFEGKAGLPKFEKGLEKLLDALKPANARIVLVTPLPFEFQNFAAQNEVLKLYADAIGAVGRKRAYFVADIGAATVARKGRTMAVLPPITDNGMHLSESGYQATAGDFLDALGAERGETIDTDTLRKAVLVKNEQFFNKWRPQNETYLFGFRKHEQGKNAKEVAEFDPFITKAEDEIAKIRKGLK